MFVCSHSPIKGVAPGIEVTSYPFRHIVVDDVFDSYMLEAVVQDFPPGDSPRWKTYTEEHEFGKQELSATSDFTAVSEVIADLRSPDFISELGDIFGIDHLIPNNWGGGMHQSGRGAHLDLHADFTRSPEGRYRRLNALLFLNDHWEYDSGGCLILSQTKIYGPPVEIPPTFNRLVVFETSSTSWHGHPVPWNDDIPRRSIAMYYYTEEQPPNFDGDHSTVWA